MKPVKLFLCVLLTWGIVSGQVLAEEEELPSSGFLAGSAIGGNGAVNLQGQWGGPDAPLTASVSKNSTEEWTLRVFNNSQDKYRASISVQLLDELGKRLKSYPVSATLQGGDVLERTIRPTPRSVNYAIKLNSWRKYEKVKTEAELKAELEAKKAEVDLLEKEIGGDQ